MKRIRQPHAKDGWYEITPAQAAVLLEARRKNRPLREAKAKEIAEDIAAGKFAENGESVVMTDDGVLHDGQHRMRGCVLANKPIVVYVVHLERVTQEIFDTFDLGKARTSGDRLSMEGAKHYNLAAAVVRLLLDYGNDKRPTGRASRYQRDVLRKAWKQNEAVIDEACSFVAECQRSRALVGAIPPSHMAFVYIKAKEQDARKAQAFVESFYTGENLGKSNPVLLLRNRLLEVARGSKLKMRPEERLALAIRAWNMYRANKTAKLLKWDIRMPFPRFDEAA